jgi:hypothetical protein
MFAHPRILDRWHEDNGRGGRLRVSSVDIGLVVALSDGIMIPVLRDLAGKSIDEVALARHKAVRRARMGRLLQADLAPVSFSLSNIGGSGADRFEAVIYPGQSGILAVGRQHERVIARAGGIAVAKGVNLAFPGSPSDRRLLGAQFIETRADGTRAVVGRLTRSTFAVLLRRRHCGRDAPFVRCRWQEPRREDSRRPRSHATTRRRRRHARDRPPRRLPALLCRT